MIEVSKNSNLKYEFDKEKKCLILDRVLHNTNFFPYNYGFIPNTLSPDGDPLDIIVLGDFSLAPGVLCDVKIIGGINTRDESGQDDKIISVLANNVDPCSKHINDLKDVNKATLTKIEYFLKRYKDNERNKEVIVENFYDRNCAINIIKKYTLKNNGINSSPPIIFHAI